MTIRVGALTFLLAIASAWSVQPATADTMPFVWGGGDGAWSDPNWNGGATLGFTFGAGGTPPNPLIATGDTVDATAATLEVRSNDTDVTSVTLDGGSTLEVGILDLEDGFALLDILDGNLVVGNHVRLDGPNGANAQIRLTAGLITMNGNHPMRGNNSFFLGDHINFVGGAGEASVVHTDLTDPNPVRTLAGRVAAGYFSIDSTVILPTADQSDIAALNAELATLAVNGRFLSIDTSVAGQQTLSLLAVPEPSALLLCSTLIGAAATRRRVRRRDAA